MHIQIYSIMTVDEALAVAEAGADRIGILVTDASNPNHFPCEISEEAAVPIFSALKGVATSVLISVALNEEAVLRQVELLEPDVLHLCAGVKGSPEFKRTLNRRCPGVELMEAVGVQDESAFDEAVRISQYADTIILDSVDPNIAGIGATGATHDWVLDREIIDSVSVPVIMAGGLGPDNVGDVLKFSPWGVDSLTKTSIVKNGVIIGKDINKVRQFCQIVKENSALTGVK
ncbi:MAG: phosphoribosylanthranilate isomerase [Oscillospiraceae bacterium]|nr:phosphoribosylanthranilate isomerase [Oscillospiraceae bacterium]